MLSQLARRCAVIGNRRLAPHLARRGTSPSSSSLLSMTTTMMPTTLAEKFSVRQFSSSLVHQRCSPAGACAAVVALPSHPQQRRHFATTNPPDFAFSMTNATKVLPGGRVLLDNASLSFYQGAKIGVIGPNGAGKSSFLKLIAGEDKEFEGDVWVSDAVELGYLPQVGECGCVPCRAVPCRVNFELCCRAVPCRRAVSCRVV